MKSETRHLPATYAALVFSGTSFDPQIVTAIVGTPPTLSYACGSKYLIKNTVKTRKTSLWVYSTRNIVETDDLGKHLKIIEELLIGSKAVLASSSPSKIKDLIEEGGIDLRVDVFWYGAENSSLPRVSRSFEQVVSTAGGIVATDFHRDGDAIEAA